jgi:SpoIID/LytB domain protein
MFVIFVIAVSSWLHPRVFVAVAASQDDPTDAVLEAISAGRSVRIRITTNGSRRILALPVELYVARVLAGEGEPNAADAAQQALAIAIRTYAAANAGRHRRDGFDLCDTTHCQVLRPATGASRRAAMATAGQVLMYAGRPAEVFYSASCGGRSEAVSQVWPGALDHPYLISTEDDVHEEEEPWVLDLPVSRVEQALRRVGFEGRRLKNLRIERRSDSGRVTRLEVSGMRPDAIAGDDFRAAIGARELRSTAFTMDKVGRAYRFTGRGYGHGVGMCVIGAGRRAARGETAAQILQQYYPGLPLAPATRAEAPERSVDIPLLLDVDRLALRVRDELVPVLGVAAPPEVTVIVHESVDSFRHSTGRPWWLITAISGSSIELAPIAVLAQRDGLEPAIRRGVVELLTSPSLADRPAWVRVGAARYFAAPPQPAPRAIKHAKCPTDAELNMAVSASAHRDAELRAEACFARGIARTGDWRTVR